jgi:hypothetical protein
VLLLFCCCFVVVPCRTTDHYQSLPINIDYYRSLSIITDHYRSLTSMILLHVLMSRKFRSR